MRNLTRMLQAVVHGKPARHTVRKIIVLKDRKSFDVCVRVLKKQGIVPVKQVKSACMLCCHVHPHAKLAELRKHPSVRRIENDARVRAHAVGLGQRSSFTRVRSMKRDHSTAKSQAASMQQIPWGIKRIQAPKVWQATRGKGIRIAMSIQVSRPIRIFASPAGSTRFAQGHPMMTTTAMAPMWQAPPQRSAEGISRSAQLLKRSCMQSRLWMKMAKGMYPIS